LTREIKIATDSTIKDKGNLKINYSEHDYPLQDESYQIIGLCMEIHRILGR
jgi:hypothetical protein